MKRLHSAWGVFLLIAAAWAGCAGAPPDTNAEPQIRALLDAQTQAWNRGDLESFLDGYWDSPDLTFSSGNSSISGWQQTLERYRRRYQGEGREMGQLRFTEVQVEMLAADAAFVRGRFNLELSTGEKPTGLFTLVLRRFPEGWRIVHDHTSS